MSKIGYQIGEDNFSLVLKEIASILVVEFARQIELGNTFLPESVSYDTDFAVNEGDTPFVSVNWLKFDNTDDYRELSQNNNQYFIDIKAKGYDVVRSIISVVRKILKSEQYITLNFVPGIISNTNIVSAGVSFETHNRSSQGTISGGVTFQCNVVESNDKPVGVLLDQSNYDLMLDQDKVLTLKQVYS